MPFALTLDGHTYRTDRLTVAQAEQIETDLGIPWSVFNPVRSAGAFRRLVDTVAGPGRGNLTLGEASRAVRWVDDDLPRLFHDGMPAGGGRSMDLYVVFFSRPPWCWPPSVTRQQTVRDLDLLIESLQ